MLFDIMDVEEPSLLGILNLFNKLLIMWSSFLWWSLFGSDTYRLHLCCRDSDYLFRA